MRNPDSTAPFWRNNLMYKMCRACEMNETCAKQDTYPLISRLTSHVLAYMNELSAGIAHYPNAGSWEHQPVWFMNLLNTARATMARMQKTIQEEEKQAANAKR